MDLSGKVVFVTGGAQGLGKGYVEAVLEKGAKVFFGDVNPTAGAATYNQLKDSYGADNIRFVPFDVTDHQQFKAAFDQAVSEFGHVDILVNNAGIMNEGAWQLMININYISVVYGTKLAVEHMRRDQGGRGGRIINISSTAGLADFPQVPIYCGTKHAVRSFTSSLALQPNVQELGIEYGILCPGATATDLILKLDDEKMHFLEQSKAQLEKMMPMSTVVEAFLELVQLEKLNGSILMIISEDGKSYRKMENVRLSEI